MSTANFATTVFFILWLGCLFLLCFTWRALFPETPRSHPRRPRSPRPLKPGTPDGCPACRAAAHLSPSECLALLTRPTPPPWSQVKGAGGPRKRLASEGRYCPHIHCPYFGITDATVHALVGDGRLRTAQGEVQIWVCACCGHHLTDTYGTFLYRLKTPLAVIVPVLTSLCRGQGLRAAAESHARHKDTVQAWWVRFGERAPALWEQIAAGQVQVQVLQLDELHTLVKKKTGHLTELEEQLGELGTQWVWTVMDPVSKVLWVAQVGPRTRDMACQVLHTLWHFLPPHGIPAFVTDGLQHYWYAITAHFGEWVADARGKPMWRLSPRLLYAQVVKHYRRRKLTQVVRRVLVGTWERRHAAMTAAGTRGSINTAFVERLNLTLRHGLAALTRRTLAIAKTKRHLQLRLNAYVVYYNLVRVHLTLQTTPACAAGLTDQPWPWEQVLNYRLPAAWMVGQRG